MKVKNSVISTIAHYGSEMIKELVDIYKKHILTIYSDTEEGDAPKRKPVASKPSPHPLDSDI
jgi:hypothetical protein